MPRGGITSINGMSKYNFFLTQKLIITYANYGISFYCACGLYGDVLLDKWYAMAHKCAGQMCEMHIRNEYVVKTHKGLKRVKLKLQIIKS